MFLNSKNQSTEQLSGLTLGAVGGMFGDIGTSPLYAFKEVFHGFVGSDDSLRVVNDCRQFRNTQESSNASLDHSGCR
ncbi:hypothetical protein METHB2_840012 [Candidatus Methylobacter favarea]|uniref:K+ potassium transporter integral membrane domain-containing protein n=1 Tax=Candidatus Methylobacter favarea TaxID=2707345 RepID=A0A8S0X9Z4_9GAMM|nr:KUP/HAK/KT family potassium transporter [Candidatus Methylobacter favarea]CAA9892846.1 hypothetical protein METHB2_840012 [Candidatus Methylobacter favarea]